MLAMNISSVEKFAQFFYCGEPTAPLLAFSRELIAVSASPDPDGWKRLRTPETHLRMLKVREEMGGVSGLVADILAKMQGQQLAFIDAMFAYDGIFPEDAKLLQTCLWSRSGGLIEEVIVPAVRARFGGLSAVVFENVKSHKSVPDIPHAHVVVDLDQRV
jgi:hypothetical protein